MQQRIAGHDTHPGGEELKHWWTETPEGLAEWAVGHEHPWTTLYHKLLKHMDGNAKLAKATAGAWYFKVFGHGPTAGMAQDKHRDDRHVRRQPSGDTGGTAMSNVRFIAGQADPAALGGKAGDPIPFIASTPGVKRDGMDLRATGWWVDAYRANPVVLWCHEHGRPPIGRAPDPTVGAVLRMPVFFDQEDPFAVGVESKTRRGFINGCSVGWDFVDKTGAPLPQWRLSADQITREARYHLTELSIVPVPADPKALAERQARGLRHFSRQLATLFDEQERPDSTALEPWVRAAVLAECRRLGIPIIDRAESAAITDVPAADAAGQSAPSGVDAQAARAILAAFPTISKGKS